MEYLYVARGRDGLVKVGRTRRPIYRRFGLASAFKKKGDVLVQYETCDPIKSAVGAEFYLSRTVAQMAKRHSGNEWFCEVEFETVLALAQRITEACIRGKRSKLPVSVLIARYLPEHV